MIGEEGHAVPDKPADDAWDRRATAAIDAAWRAFDARAAGGADAIRDEPWFVPAIEAALLAAEEVIPSVPRDELNADAVVCGDCAAIARPGCGHHGHGLVELGALLDHWNGC